MMKAKDVKEGMFYRDSAGTCFEITRVRLFDCSVTISIRGGLSFGFALDQDVDVLAEEPFATLTELHKRIAKDRMDRMPQLYAGHFDDALFYARKQYPTKSDAVCVCKLYGINTQPEAD